MRLAIIEKEFCNPQACGNYLCARMCPLNRAGEDCILKENKPRINEDICNGCGICQAKCPFNAISIINLPGKLAEEPIHRYGTNMFELFRLPIPKKGAVVGIIGMNGIGKSTALAILSGNLNPNIGNTKTSVGKPEIIKKYPHIALGAYFKALFAGKVSIAYKPQRIDLLPQIQKGKVSEFLKKIDKIIIDELGLYSLSNKNIEEISGGELQKLAIAATASKKAELYFFDEPMSFLDVTTRIKTAKLIRSLAVNSAVVVVEHDLAVLDYISDEIQIIYGKPGCYGIASQSKAVNRGINEYLGGYLAEDNMRFRSYEIKFAKSPEKRAVAPVLLNFPELEKSFPGFLLKVNSGSIHKSEVLAVMGANGLGKTTFLKLLAGLEKPDKGVIERIKIAYKQQYPVSVDGKVIDWLKNTAGADFSTGWYKSMIEKLGLNRVLNQEIKNLSGGELQKVYIAITLSQDVQFYAFDEPSAFIDVEDRLKIAEVIKEFVRRKDRAAIVVDHDVQFIDYIGDSMLVFEGTPGEQGFVYGPCNKREGMNRVLKMLNITYRKDIETNRAKINKPDSVLDREQRAKGEFYYTDVAV